MRLFNFDTEWLTQVQVFDSHRVCSRPGNVSLVHCLRVNSTEIKAREEGREEGKGGEEKENLWHALFVGRRFSLKWGLDQL